MPSRSGEFANRAAEVPCFLERHMLDRIDPKSVAIGDRDPVFVAVDQGAQRACGIECEILECKEIRPLVLCVRILHVVAAQGTESGSRNGRHAADRAATRLVNAWSGSRNLA